MRIRFNNKEYVKYGRNMTGLGAFCFDIFKTYIQQHKNIEYYKLKDIFNNIHCNNNKIIQNQNEYSKLTKNQQERYFEPIQYNELILYFSTQWGNNGYENGLECNNINHMIDFAKQNGYNVEILETDINTNNDFNQENNIISFIQTKNIILYGAPGIGKTHNYQNLITMIEENKDEKYIFDSIINNNTPIILNQDSFKTIQDEKRIQFITFHQSYSYEDFIEGFRPQEDGSIKLEDGIFKLICKEAQQNLDDSKKDIALLSSERKLQDSFNEFVEYLLTQDKINLTNSVYISNIDDSAFYYTSNSNGMKNVKIPFDDIKEFIHNNIEEQKDIKNLSNVMGTTRQRPNYPFIIYKKYLEFNKNNPNDKYINIEQVEQKNYYLVIDEINRGNISKIFGELITLIEEDKRDIYDVTLPYSKENFKIPSNLFIIATMNSTDKSIATIDIALRRRFTFLKMLPNPNLVTYPQAKELMITLNDFIKENLNKDYQIGHSYFMKIQNDDELKFVKEYKIKPLLEEYFYADEEKLNEVKKILNY